MSINIKKLNLLQLALVPFFTTVFYLDFIFLKDLNFSNALSAKTSKENKIFLKSEYLLGPGDAIKIIFNGLEIYSDVYSISPDGYLFLPELGKIHVTGMTLMEINEKITKSYNEFIINPEIELSIEIYRPISFLLKGEINKPGLYRLDRDNNNIEGTKSNISSQEIWRLFDAIKLGEGFTIYSDLSKVTILRENSKSNGGGKLITSINLISLLKNGDFSQNIIIKDKDVITINKSAIPLKDQINEINKTNITSDFINVYINGNVLNPGLKSLPKGISLNNAISTTGGLKSFAGQIEFIRLNDYSKAKKRKIKFDITAEKGSLKNPILQNNDIIFARKNILGKTSDALSEISTPLFTGLGLYEIFN